LGHHIGDELLQVVAQRLLSCIRPHEGDMVVRLGGDEFVLVLGGAHLGVAEAVASRIQEALKKPVKLHGHELYTTASIGILPDCSRYETPEEILRDTDTAMFRAKEAGRARPAIFEPSMRARAISHLRFETDLRRAVERREFIVQYQPVVWLATGGVVGFEASLYWRHPDRGLLPSKEFTPLAQESGLGYDLDQLLLDEACRKAALWREGFPEHYPPMISVSLSAETLFREGVHDEIARTIKEAGFPGHALMIGFSEETITENPERAVAALKPLKALDVRLALDGFGSGRSSLGFLHRLPADTLKVDTSFARHIGEIEDTDLEKKDRAEVVRTILTVAHEFGMEVVAEGVQTHEQMRALSEMYCDYAQGPRFSRPVDADRVEAILAAEPSW
ncbi:MAG: putative bifunctional diguanylate cyclase/phosphodiesterase, partial [Rubrobacteraceae bacterium]